MYVGLCGAFVPSLSFHLVPPSLPPPSDLKPLLTAEAVTDLVLDSMKRLPRHIPRPFKNSYTPIAAAGTDAQVG